MTTLSLGKIAFSWKQAYSAVATYQKQDVVSYNGDSYVCLVDGTVNVAPTANGPAWQLFAQGTQGVSSSAGEVVYNNGTSLVALPPGAAGQVLTIDANGFPSWGTPDIRSGTKVKKLPNVSNGRQTTCYRRMYAIMTDNSVRGWGYNDSNNLGDGTALARPTPTRPAFPPGFPGAAELYADYSTSQYCIDLNGKLWTWGANGYGQLGANDTTARTVPFYASGVATSSIFGKTITQVAISGGNEGYVSVMVLASDGTVHACGYNGYGQLGLGDLTQRNQFVQVAVPSNVKQIVSGRARYTANYAVTNAGAIYSWGYNGDGQLGDGGTANASIATLRTGGSLNGKTITKIFAGSNHAFALASDGTLHGWGTNTTYGQLGNGTLANQFTPVQVATNVADLYNSSYDYPVVFIKKTDGTIWAAGAGNYGANGSTTAVVQSSFVQITGLGTTCQKVVTGGTGSYNFAAFLMSNGTVYTMGYNGNGQLGVGDVAVRQGVLALVPLAIRTVVDIAAYGSTSEGALQFLLDDGQVATAGYGGQYMNGDNLANLCYTPFPIVF